MSKNIRGAGDSFHGSSLRPIFLFSKRTCFYSSLFTFPSPPCVYRHSEGWRVYSDSSPTLHHSSPIPKTNRRKLQRKTARHPWGGCVISLDNSWVHNSWPPHAHHLLCMRISAAMQAHNSCCATEDTDCLNNISYLFQQQEEGES